MKRKLTVIVLLLNAQSAHTFWPELFRYIPVLKNISAVLAVTQSKRQSRIQAPPSDIEQPKSISQDLAIKIMDATNANCLKISANIPGNITIEPHDSTQLIIQPKAKASSLKALPNITYNLERDAEKHNSFILNSYDRNVTPNQKSSIFSAFWNTLLRRKKIEPESTENLNSLDFSIRIPKKFKHLTNDSYGEGNFSLTSADTLEISCICSLKNGGNIVFNNIKGSIDASTTKGTIKATNIFGLLMLATSSGIITVSKWVLPDTPTNNTLTATLGKVNVELPENIKVTTKDSTDITYKQKTYKSNQAIKKGSGLHELTITTMGKIELD